MENTIIVKGTVHEPESFFSRDGVEGTRFKLAVYAGKVGTEYAPSIWYSVKIMERANLTNKQRDVVVSGDFGAYKGTDGKIYHTLWAKKIMPPPPKDTAPNWGANDDVPF